MSAPLAATVAALILTLVVVARWIRHPWAACSRCNGEGHHDLWLGGKLPCRICGGTGNRQRLVWRVFGRGMRLALRVQKMRTEARATR